jgi:metalloendopeptidase OMA1, mitochondrial
MATWTSDDGSLPEDSTLMQWCRDLNRASELSDRPLSIANRHKQWHKEVGFVDVQEWVFKMPLNEWPRDPRMKAIGYAWKENMLEGLSGFTMAPFNKVLGQKEEDIQVSSPCL